MVGGALLISSYRELGEEQATGGGDLGLHLGRKARHKIQIESQGN